MERVVSFGRTIPRQSAGAGGGNPPSAAPALEDPTAIMESLITGTGFDIAMAQNDLLPPQELPPEELPPVGPQELPMEPLPVELAGAIDGSDLTWLQSYFLNLT
jgi:hypothetical protein